jgi:FAD/FMN-containing dehydrogenase
MFELDEISHLITTDTDLSVAEIEKELNAQGYTLGYFSPPSNKILLEEVLGQRMSNLYSLLYGELPDLCVSFHFETNADQVIQTKLAPRQATGPNWKNLLIGTDRQLGLIYQATLKIFPQPAAVQYSWVGFESEEDSYELEREMKRRELFPRVFGRFPKKELHKWVSSLRGEFFLLLEWAGSSGWVDAALSEWSRFVGKDYSHHLLEKKNCKQDVAKLLRKKIPEIPWAGIVLSNADEEALKIEKELLAELC